MKFKTKIYKLEEILKINYGKNQKKVIDNDGKFPILGTGGVMGYANQYLYNKPSVLIGRKGTIDKIRYIDEPFWTVDTLFYTQIDEDLVLPKYIYYYLKTIDFKHYNEGTTIPSLRTETLNRILVSLPELDIQLSVVNILDNIDEKINLNEKTIATLEELSSTLFKHWFVNFEFPDENSNPYKLSGGKMVESELGKIPEGWKVKNLKEIVNYSSKAFNPKKTDSKKVAHFSIPEFDSRKFPIIDETESIKSNKYYIDESSILVSKMNPKTPRVWLPNISKMHDNVCSTEFIVLNTTNQNKKSFIYELCKSTEFTNFLISHATGSTNSRQRVTPSVAINYSLPWNEKKVEEYGEMIKNQHLLILKLREQNMDLASLRNTLLPKLLSGEIELPTEEGV